MGWDLLEIFGHGSGHNSDDIGRNHLRATHRLLFWVRGCQRRGKLHSPHLVRGALANGSIPVPSIPKLAAVRYQAWPDSVKVARPDLQPCSQRDSSFRPAASPFSLGKPADFVHRRKGCSQTFGTNGPSSTRRSTLTRPRSRLGKSCMTMTFLWYFLPLHSYISSSTMLMKCKKIHIANASSPEEDPQKIGKAVKLMHRFTPDQVQAKMDQVEES